VEFNDPVNMDKGVQGYKKDFRRENFEKFRAELDSGLKAGGYNVVSSSENPDMNIRLKVRFFSKKQGTFYLAFFVFPFDLSSTADGMLIDALYEEGGKKASKSYRVYTYQYTGKIVSAIIDDIDRQKAEGFGADYERENLLEKK
jgi:hypothetical protein